MRFKRGLQTANVTARPWSHDILRFAVCGLPFPTKNLMLKVPNNDSKQSDEIQAMFMNLKES